MGGFRSSVASSIVPLEEWIELSNPPRFDDDEIMRGLFCLEIGFLSKKLGREAAMSDFKSFSSEHHPDWIYLLLRKVAAWETTISGEEIAEHFALLDEFEPELPEASSSSKNFPRGTFRLESVDGYPGATGRIVYGDVMAVCIRFEDGTLMSSYSGPFLVDENEGVATHFARAGFTAAKMKRVNPAAAKRGGSFAPRRRAFELSDENCLTITTIGGSTRTKLVFRHATTTA